jgi:hypothetical protein
MGETAATPAVFPTGMNIGGLALKASGAVTSSTQETAVIVGKGKFRIVTTVTAVDVASTDEGYVVNLEANTAAATSTWFTLATLLAGGATTVWKMPSVVIGTYVTIVENPYDYQVRVTTTCLASGSSITFSVDAYPVESNA